MKSRLALLCVLGILFLLSGCAEKSTIISDPSDKPSSTIVENKGEEKIDNNSQSINAINNDIYNPIHLMKISLNDPSVKPEYVGQQLFIKYLDYYKGDKIPEEERLKWYKIDEIKIISGNIDEFVFFARYTVQTYIENSPLWHAGNGTIKGSGLIEGKSLYVWVSKDKDTYKVTNMGTSDR